MSCIQRPFKFDPSQTASFLEGGYIYYSPNCSRPVPAPRHRHYTQPPFNSTNNERDHFVEPVWWTDSFGWMGYVPLAPYFTAAPFRQLCWLPKVNCVGRNAYQMDAELIEEWRYTEKQMVDACHDLRLWYGIAATTPPKPSEFGYPKEHKSTAVCKRRIQISRDWFVIWFGFLSFLLSEAERRHIGPVGELPNWYLRLQEEGYPDSWLSGLMSSSVYSFTPATPRVGVFIQLSREDKYRPPIHYLLDLHIPVWLVWTKHDESLFVKDPKLALFVPAKQQLLDALEAVYRSGWVPSAGEIIKNYYDYEGDFKDHQIQQLRAKYAPEVIFQFLMEKMAAEFRYPSLLAPATEKLLPPHPAPPQLPQQGMVERQSHALQEKYTQLFPSWEEFFKERESRQAEMIKSESAQERQARISRERSRGTKKARVFTWEKIVTSGGMIVFARVAVTKSQNEDVLSEFTLNQKKYNAFANEWDAFEGFAPDEYVSDGDGDYSDDAFDEIYGTKAAPQQPQRHQAEYSPSPIDRPVDLDSSVHTPPRHQTPPDRDVSTPARHARVDAPAQSMEIEEENSGDIPLYSSDVGETVSRQYGYVSPLGAQVGAKSSLTWWKLLYAIGFHKDPKNDISETEQAAIISFIGALSSNQRPHHDLWDLEEFNRASLSGLSNILDVDRPTPNMYIFAKPVSTACRWKLGVASAAAALYVLRVLLSNPTHTILSVAGFLISRGVCFQTFLNLRDLDLGPPCLSAPFAPTAVRFVGYTFTVADFDAAMVHCCQVLNQPQGRAALLMGGILWRIAKQYLSLDGALIGPSIEVTVHRSGHLIVDEKLQHQLWDDALTENEMRVICGSYKLLTGRGLQETIKSWFPPSEIWSNMQTSGQCWLEWTEINEQWFLSHLENIQTGKFQPLSAREWRDKLRMSSKALSISKKLIAHNEKLALDFVDENLKQAL